MKKRLTVIQAILLMGLAFALAYNMTTFSEQAKYNERLANIAEKEKEYGKMVEVEEYVAKSFVGDYQKSDLLDGAMTGYISALDDKYSYYMSVEEFEAYKARLSGEFGGIGVSVVYDDEAEGLKILEVYNDSPAGRNGLKAFDIIVQIDGVSVEELGYYGSVLRIKDEVGTPVVLTIMREGVKEPIKVTVVREIVKTQTVFTDMVTEDTARLRVVEFGTETNKQFKQELEKLIQNNIGKVIIDLRFNPGGELTSLVSMMDILLGECVTFVQKDKEGVETTFSSDAEMLNINIAVLVNEYSYSAAEYFAAVMQEYRRGPIVGEKTTGKGYAQKPIPLSDGSGLVLSVMKYYTPSGASLAETGVTPDYAVEMSAADKASFRSLTIEQDKQLMKAIELLK